MSSRVLLFLYCKIFPFVKHTVTLRMYRNVMQRHDILQE